jgi:hypothetical protein
LGNFIPSLLENRCLERKSNGAVLRQVGAQDVAMGVKFSAACTLDCTEYLEGVPAALCSMSGSSSSSDEDADTDSDASGRDDVGTLLPLPRSTLPGQPCQDIAFNQLDGDFQVCV